MSGRGTDEAVIGRLASLAQASAPPALAETAADAMIAAAVARANARRARTRTAGRAGWIAAAAALLLVAGALLARRGEEDRASAEQPLRMELPTGDTLLATPGARFRLASSEPAARRVAMERGTMLFDVARLGDGQTFEVETPHLSVRVLGTVFSVTAGEDETIVRVFEGAVLVRRGESRRVVRASLSLSSRDDVVEPIDEGGALGAEGFAAAARRAARHDPPEDEVLADQARGPRRADEPATVEHAADLARAAPDTEHAADLARASRDTERRPDRAVDPAAARALIARGRASAALGYARGHEGVAWRLVEADALRALHRFEEAAALYDRAAAVLDPAGAAQAGYRAASIRFTELGDHTGCLASLDRASADAAGSPLEERSLALRTRALRRAGRADEARAVALRYLERFPAGGMAEYMRALGEGESGPPPRDGSAERRDELP